MPGDASPQPRGSGQAKPALPLSFPPPTVGLPRIIGGGCRRPSTAPGCFRTSRRLISGRNTAKAKKRRQKGGQMLRKSPVHGFPSLLVIEASGFENCHGAVVGRDAAISLDLMPTNAGSTEIGRASCRERV